MKIKFTDDIVNIVVEVSIVIVNDPRMIAN